MKIIKKILRAIFEKNDQPTNQLLTWSVDHILNFSYLNFLTFFNKMILIMYEFGQIPAIIKAIQQTKLNVKAKNLIFGTLDHSKMLLWDFWMILHDLVVLPNVETHLFLS